MSVTFTATGWALRPGGLPRLIEGGNRAAAIHRRLGASAVEAWSVTTPVNGPVLIYNLRHESGEAWGDFTARMAADPGWQAWGAEFVTPDAPYSFVTHTLITGLGADDPAPAGQARMVRVYTVEKGRGAEALEILEEARANVRRLGAGRCLLGLGQTGAYTGQVLTVWDFASLAALGKYADAIVTDAAMQRFNATRLLATGSPLTMLSASVQVRLPIG